VETATVAQMVEVMVEEGSMALEEGTAAASRPAAAAVVVMVVLLVTAMVAAAATAAAARWAVPMEEGMGTVADWVAG
jgi:hypothetical protein